VKTRIDSRGSLWAEGTSRVVRREESTEDRTLLAGEQEAPGNAWRIWSGDTTTGGWTYNDFYNPPALFQTAELGILEAYNPTNPNGQALYSCTELPASSDNSFALNPSIYQAGPYWYSFNDVWSSVRWTPFPSDPATETPNCYWYDDNWVHGADLFWDFQLP
jgi:hypothetical protein